MPMRDVFQSGAEPEFTITDIIHQEVVDTGLLRLYLVSERAGIKRLEFTVLISRRKLSEIAKKALSIAAVRCVGCGCGETLTLQ